MFRSLAYAAALATAVSSFGAPAVVADGEPVPRGDERSFSTRSSGLYRVKDLFTGDVRALWVGDSWALLNNTARLPYGSLLVWPIGRLEAVCVGFHRFGLGGSADYTSGPGSLTPVDSAHGWIAEINEDGPARIAVPVNDITRVDGDPGLVLDGGWAGPPRVQDLGIRNGIISAGDLPVFTAPGDHANARVLYYCPRDLPDLAESVTVLDQDATVLATPALRAGARGFWHLGDDPIGGAARVPLSSQMNALAADLPLGTNLGNGPRLVVAENPDLPLVGSGGAWFLAGGVFYRTDAAGERVPGYYHSVLSTVSWQLYDFATSAPSTGNKRFTDEQLIPWLDVTTLDRQQSPIIILHIATEQLDESIARQRVEAICQRFRDAYASIGTVAPRFLLVGSYMSRTGNDLDPSDRLYVEAFNAAMLSVAQDFSDCAFVSLYAMTDGTYFTSDARGGPGTQQAARDWLDANGWSTISYGGSSYNLSSADDNGLDGVLSADGLHIGFPPAAAFFAKLIAQEIQASRCPADFNNDGSANTLDVLAFLNAWNADDPSSDIDGNGEIDTRDVLAFLNLWNRDC
jgi:hypothetical protein